MIRLKRLYSEPEAFSPIPFESGLNFIIGEKSEGSNKTNGVGKSVSIEFLNYCFLKKSSESRVLRIPASILDKATKINLDLVINSHQITISRSIESPNSVIIFKNNEEINFDNLDDASSYLSNIYFENYPPQLTRITFRNLLAPIIRDEKSEFKDIIKCYDTDKSIPRDYKPHLFFLGLDVSHYVEIGKIINELDKKTKYVSTTKKIMTNNNDITVSEAKAELNELESEVSKINASVERLKNNESFEVIQSELVVLETQLNEIRTKQKAIKYEIKQIESLPSPEHISENEIAILFNQFRSGLGDMIEKSMNEVKEFRDKIDSFKNALLNKRLQELKKELSELNKKASEKDEKYSKKIQLIDDGQLLTSIKTSINIFNKKNQQLNNLRSLIERYDIAEREKKELNTNKTTQIQEFDKSLDENDTIIQGFEETILNIHQNIMDNRLASFSIETINKARRKEFLNFDLRTDDDGSHSTDRMKVFIYDIALLFDNNTRKHHPQFLVHDNIFDVDNDSLEKSLNFLYKQDLNMPNEFQYILTLNRDSVEILENNERLDFNIDNYKRATFTKADRFLKTKYTQITKKR